jgi:hypothetical protein
LRLDGEQDPLQLRARAVRGWRIRGERGVDPHSGAVLVADHDQT